MTEKDRNTVLILRGKEDILFQDTSSETVAHDFYLPEDILYNEFDYEVDVLILVTKDEIRDGGRTGLSFILALDLMEKGWNLHDVMIWHKTNAPPIHKNNPRYTDCFEYIMVFTKGDLKVWNPLYQETKTKGLKVKRSGDVSTTVGEKKLLGNVLSYKTYDQLYHVLMVTYGGKEIEGKEIEE